MGGQSVHAASIVGLQCGSLLALRLVAPLAYPFIRVREEAGCAQGCRDSFLSPKPICPGRSPRPVGKLWGVAWPGSASRKAVHTRAREGVGCPGRVKASFQDKIPQQKAGSASELKSKC